MKGSTLMWYSAYNPEGTLIMHITRASAPFCAGAWMRLVSKSLTPCKTRDKKGVSPAGCCTDPDDTLANRGRQSGAENMASGFSQKPETRSLTAQPHSAQIRQKLFKLY